jgi:hypothetical protein
MILTCLSIVVLGTFLVSCASMPTPSEGNFKTPVVKLNSVEVAHYWGWWYYSKKIEPTKGKAGDYGAPLDLAFILDIENPNPYPVMMEYLKFTVAFEEFDLNTVMATETQWIPAGKTNQVRAHAMFDGRQSLLSLLVTGGFKLQEKGMGTGAGAALKQLGIWWEGFPEFSFPIHVKEGSAVFTANGVMGVTSFSGTFPME